VRGVSPDDKDQLIFAQEACDLVRMKAIYRGGLKSGEDGCFGYEMGEWAHLS